MSSKVFDIVAPKDNWERGYAVLEYTRLGLFKQFRKTIKVNYD